MKITKNLSDINLGKMTNEEFENILCKAGALALEKQGEQYEPCEPHVFSKSSEKAFKKQLRKYNALCTLRAIGKYSSRAACILLAVAVVSGVTIMSVRGLRSEVLNFIFDSKTPNSVISFDDGTNEYKDTNIYSSEKVDLNYIPEGFVLLQKTDSKGRLHLYFKNNDKYLQFSIQNLLGNGRVDTEEIDAEIITINDTDAFLISKPEVNMILWNNENSIIRITSNLDKNEAIKVAENTIIK